jgi:hypothetical protein
MAWHAQGISKQGLHVQVYTYAGIYRTEQPAEAGVDSEKQPKV